MLIALFASVASATVYSFDTDLYLPSNAPASGRHLVAASDLGHSDESVSKGASHVDTDWSPLACEIVSGGEFWLTLDDRDSSHWPTIPSTASCSSTFGSNTYVLTIHLHQVTVDYSHDGGITSLATGAYLALGSSSGACGGAYSPLPVGSPSYEETTVTATKDAGGSWTGVTCTMVNAVSGSQQFIELIVTGSAVATTGYCRMPKTGTGHTDVPITVTR